jgi:hypothetical protein
MEATEEKVDATAEAVETKATEEKAATEEVKQDVAAVELGKEFDKKADEGDDHSAYTETPEDKAKAEAEAKADEKSSVEDPNKEDAVDDSLLERAVRVGLNLKQAKEYGSLLESTVSLLEESQSKKAETSEGNTEAETKAKEAAKAKDDEAPYDCGLDPAEYDEGLIKGLNELGTMLKKRVVALETGHTKNTESLQSNRISKHTEWLDSKVNHLPEELTEVYGKGECDDIEMDSDQFKARAALDTKISTIASELRAAKKPVPPRNKLFDMAIAELHKSTIKADDKTKAKLKARAKEALGGGSGRVSAETAEAKALQANQDFDKQLDD